MPPTLPTSFYNMPLSGLNKLLICLLLWTDWGCRPTEANHSNPTNSLHLTPVGEVVLQIPVDVRLQIVNSFSGFEAGGKPLLSLWEISKQHLLFDLETGALLQKKQFSGEGPNAIKTGRAFTENVHRQTRVEDFWLLLSSRSMLYQIDSSGQVLQQLDLQSTVETSQMPVTIAVNRFYPGPDGQMIFPLQIFPRSSAQDFSTLPAAWAVSLPEKEAQKHGAFPAGLQEDYWGFVDQLYQSKVFFDAQDRRLLIGFAADPQVQSFLWQNGQWTRETSANIPSSRFDPPEPFSKDRSLYEAQDHAFQAEELYFQTSSLFGHFIQLQVGTETHYGRCNIIKPNTESLKSNPKAAPRTSITLFDDQLQVLGEFDLPAGVNGYQVFGMGKYLYAPASGQDSDENWKVVRFKVQKEG